MTHEVRMTLDEAKAGKSTVDWKKVHATTEENIQQHMIEDGEDVRIPVILNGQTVRS